MTESEQFVLGQQRMLLQQTSSRCCEGGRSSRRDSCTGSSRSRGGSGGSSRGDCSVSPLLLLGARVSSRHFYDSIARSVTDSMFFESNAYAVQSPIFARSTSV